jgi:hypothetical protein
MISLSRSIAVNGRGMPRLTRSDVFAGLKMKADNALPFVPAITHCEVVERRSDRQFVRDIELRGQKLRELVTLEPETRVTFERQAGPVLGTILNEIEEDGDGNLSLRFSFKLTLEGVAAGSDEELAYEETMQADYLKAVDATLSAIRRAAVSATGSLPQ